ncbi:MAG: LptE family protein [Bacteroidota bacterium]|nr:LptE family protein [Bacteroidota bacterium]MDP4229516.1 LptE family protein [Bacteroidota bacterium]MDP4235863.1 LptE family protein [Bacteroidota bacterium]
MKIFRTPSLLLLTALVIVVGSCYSFTGASLPAGIKSIAIPLAADNSNFAQADVRQQLTDQLVQKFTRDGSLSVRDRSVADALLDVTITGISDQPIGVRTGEELTNKRVTITVDASYRDQKKQKTFWEKSFQQTADYPISQGLEGLNAALKNAEDKLSNDLLLGVLSNW